MKGWRPHNSARPHVLSFTPICGQSSLDKSKGQLSEISQYARNVTSTYNYTKSEKKMVGLSESLEKMMSLLVLKLARIYW